MPGIGTRLSSGQDFSLRVAGGILVFGMLTLTAAAQAPVTVRVDATSHGNAVPANFTGLSFERGTENSGNAGVPGYLFSPTDKPLITLFQNVGIHSLRVGGGSVDTESLVTNTTANDNLFQFAAAAGVKVIYTVRMLNTKNAFPDLPENDAAIAGYIWQNYRPLVSNFAIGNEPDWHNPYHTSGDPAIFETTPGVAGTAYPSYLADWTNFTSTISAATPGALYSGPDTGAYSTATYYNGQSWTQHFADDEKNSGLIADITQHFYVGGSPSTTTATQAIDNMLSSDWVNDTAIGTQPSGAGDGKTTTFAPYPWLYANNLAPVQADGLPYRLTEFNDYLTGVPGASNGYAAALWALDAMHWWAQHGAAGVNFHNKQWIFTDTIVPSPYPCSPNCGNFQTNAKGYGIKAFDLSSHGYIEPVTLENSENVNLTAYAVGDAHDLYVTVVNKTHTSTHDATDAAVTIAPNGFGAATCSSMTLTDGTDGDASLMTASLGGAAITNSARWQGQWTPIGATSNGQCTVTVQAASAAVVTFRAASAYAGPIQINQNGALEVFGTGPSGNVLDDTQSSSAVPDSSVSSWQGWKNDLSGIHASGGLAVVRNLDNTLEVLASTGTGDVQSNTQVSPGGAWSGWSDMGSTSAGVGSLVAANNADGSLTVCGIGTNLDVWCASENAPGVGWSAWADLGATQIQPGFVIGQDLSGRLEIFGVDEQSAVWSNVQTSSGGWSGWNPLPAMSSGPGNGGPFAGGPLDARLAIARNLDGRLELFGVTASGYIWHVAEQSPGGAWGGWALLNEFRVQPGFVVGQNADGSLAIFAFQNQGMPASTNVSRELWSISQNGPGGSWSSWMPVSQPALTSSIAAGNTADGRIQLFGIGRNGDVWSNWQTAAAARWNGWVDFGGNGVSLNP